MLISMPTGTSTIFGVFQAILELLHTRRDYRRHHFLYVATRCRFPTKLAFSAVRAVSSTAHALTSGLGSSANMFRFGILVEAGALAIMPSVVDSNHSDG
jgi:hypothetical protein